MLISLIYTAKSLIFLISLIFCPKPPYFPYSRQTPPPPPPPGGGYGISLTNEKGDFPLSPLFFAVQKATGMPIDRTLMLYAVTVRSRNVLISGC